jgi:uncharacterized membrane protein YebE (DUF533 family)
MNTQELLDKLLASGRELAEQGKDLAAQGIEKGSELANQGMDYATENYNFPEAGPERDEMLKKLGAGAAVGGLLALLVGTKSGRKVLSPAIKIGGLAALGTVGYKAYKNWQEQQGLEANEKYSIINLEGQAAADRSLSILRAMIAAAKADGTIDADERQAIMDQIKAFGLEASATDILFEEIQKPLDASLIAAMSDSPEMAVELYLASMVIVNHQSESEQAYLEQLASALNLEPSLIKELESGTLAA